MTGNTSRGIEPYRRVRSLRNGPCGRFFRVDRVLAVHERAARLDSFGTSRKAAMTSAVGSMA